jgi:hypothetical protein
MDGSITFLCAVCLDLPGDPREAVTIIDGTAVCMYHRHGYADWHKQRKEGLMRDEPIQRDWER